MNCTCPFPKMYCDGTCQPQPYLVTQIIPQRAIDIKIDWEQAPAYADGWESNSFAKKCWWTRGRDCTVIAEAPAFNWDGETSLIRTNPLPWPRDVKTRQTVQVAGMTPIMAKASWQVGKEVQYRNDLRYKGLPLEWTDVDSSHSFNDCFEYRLRPPNADANSALKRQVGGSHYKDFAIQPIEYIHANGLGFLEGNALKYLSRYKSKGGVQDLEKAKHYIDLLIELETKRSDNGKR